MTDRHLCHFALFPLSAQQKEQQQELQERQDSQQETRGNVLHLHILALLPIATFVLTSPCHHRSVDVATDQYDSILQDLSKELETANTAMSAIVDEVEKLVDIVRSVDR
ncbi:hypothetical protein FBU59_003802 [Linderina macrospora]|uniref:Uncharacterized protein n=1 Tax=Linderina macrospora TaxID=4868 RepID=A0ACC1J7H3_9FUNG|nr:hypothetical protein FBU59_003802 [Linderina macrospora]